MKYQKRKGGRLGDSSEARIRLATRSSFSLLGEIMSEKEENSYRFQSKEDFNKAVADAVANIASQNQKSEKDKHFVKLAVIKDSQGEEKIFGLTVDPNRFFLWRHGKTIIICYVVWKVLSSLSTWWFTVSITQTFMKFISLSFGHFG